MIPISLICVTNKSFCESAVILIPAIAAVVAVVVLDDNDNDNCLYNYANVTAIQCNLFTINCCKYKPV